MTIIGACRNAFHSHIIFFKFSKLSVSIINPLKILVQYIHTAIQRDKLKRVSERNSVSIYLLSFVVDCKRLNLYKMP